MKQLTIDYHSRYICEIQIPMEAYRDYISKSYDLLIKEAINQDVDTNNFLEKSFEFDKEEYYSSPDSIKDDLNREIIQLWHSSIIISLCSLLEKGLKMGIEIHHNIKYSEGPEFNTNNLKNEKLNSSKKLIEVLYNYFINELGFELMDNSSKKFESLLEYYTIRNKLTHGEEYKLDIKTYSKDKLISISREIESFLEYIYYGGKSSDPFDEIF